MGKISERCFCLAFLLILFVPFLFTNFKQNQVSEIDNSYLPELQWSEDTPVGDKINIIEKYLNMRIGFRDQMLTMYQILNDRLFHLMEHPLYMYGKNGYVYFKFWTYIADYQNLIPDQEYADEFAREMKAFSDLSGEKGAKFYYLLIPDKKTIYPEYFPDGINKFDGVSRTEQILHSMSEEGVNWVYPYEALMEGKQHRQVFNVKYDAGHWNDFGAFDAVCGLYQRLRIDFPEIPMLSEEDYDISTDHVDSLLVSRFPIDEEVPVFTLKASTAVSDSDWLNENLDFSGGNYSRTRYVNPQKRGLPKFLLFHDSYFPGRELLFTENFSEVTFIDRSYLLGTKELENFLNVLKPDIVVFENPERVIDLHFDVPKAE